MFWSIFLIGNSKVVEITPFENNLTLIVGYLIFALYHVINITIMINMLIAMMARSYDSILHHSDTEWKFARSKLYMEFIREGATLPVPLNIIPMPSFIYECLKHLFYCFSKNNKGRRPTNEFEMPSFHNTRHNNSNGVGKTNPNKNHNNVIRFLFFFLI